MSAEPKTGARSETPMYRLDSKPYAGDVKRATERAERALGRYGEPTMSLEELRAVLDRELGRVSLSDLILRERGAQW